MPLGGSPAKVVASLQSSCRPGAAVSIPVLQEGACGKTFVPMSHCFQEHHMLCEGQATELLNPKSLHQEGTHARTCTRVMRPWAVSLMPCEAGHGGLWLRQVSWQVNASEVHTAGRDVDRRVQGVCGLMGLIHTKSGLGRSQRWPMTMNGTFGADTV